MVSTEQALQERAGVEAARARSDSTLDAAAAHLAKLTTGDKGDAREAWGRKREGMRETYRSEVARLVVLAGAVRPEDQPAAPTVDAASVSARLDAIGGLLDTIIKQHNAQVMDAGEESVQLTSDNGWTAGVPVSRPTGCTVDRLEGTGNAAGRPTD